MRNWFNGILAGFEYGSVGEFFHSLAPTVKYHSVMLGISTSFILSLIDRCFGLNGFAFGALLVTMAMELFSGMYASHVNKISFSSGRMSRFSFKSACYLVLIGAPYLLATSYTEHNNSLAAGFFYWLHVFFVIHIAVENIISILENIAVIQGKDKTYWINIIKQKLTTLR